MLQGLAAKSFGTGTVRTPDVLPRETVVIFGRLVPVDRFWMTAVVVLTAVVLVLVYRYTKFGLLTRAASESISRAESRDRASPRAIPRVTAGSRSQSLTS